MKPRIPRVTTILLRRLARALSRHLPLAISGDGRGVHQARVASRRLREAVPVLSTGLSGSKAGRTVRTIRRLTRALGTVRELDVTLVLLDELVRAPDVSPVAIEAVRAFVVEERSARREVMLKRLGRLKPEKLDRRIASVGSALEGATGEPWRKALSARLLKRCRRLNEAMDAAGHMYDPERLHGVRIAAKKLRYGLELASDGGVSQAGPLVRSLKRVQDLLGKLHDLQVLQTYIAGVQIAQSASRSEPRAALGELARHVEDQCRHLHGRYVALAPNLRGVTIATRKAIVPQLAHVAPRKPLKMSLPAHVSGQRAVGSR